MQTQLTKLRDLLSSGTYGLEAIKNLVTTGVNAITSGTYGLEAIKNLVTTGVNAITSGTYGLEKLNNKLSGTFRGAIQCYPSLAAGVALTGAPGAWTRGAWTEVVPAATITTSKYVVYDVVVESITGVHQIEFGQGGAGSEASIGNIKVLTSGRFQLHLPLLGANTRLSARTASAAGGSQQVVVTIHYKLSED